MQSRAKCLRLHAEALRGQIAADDLRSARVPSAGIALVFSAAIRFSISSSTRGRRLAGLLTLVRCPRSTSEQLINM